jgi:hypothetical protein
MNHRHVPVLSRLALGSLAIALLFPVGQADAEAEAPAGIVPFAGTQVSAAMC